MHIRAPAIVCAIRPHGEHGAVVRVLTRDHGLLGGYVQGAHAREKRPILIPANHVAVDLRARTGAQLPSLSLELTGSYAPLLQEPLAAAALSWLTSLCAQTLPEGQAYPRVFDMLEAVLAAIMAAPAARDWAATVVQFEALLLSELGYGLDLETCAVTGAVEELSFVSPKTGRGVSAAGAVGFEPKLLPLPAFLYGGGKSDWPDILDGLNLTGHFLERRLLADRRNDILSVRARLVERLTRAAS